MWARRLGVPHLWPSRVKVFFRGILTSVVILSVFQYLHGANVEYLNLEKPYSNEIMCTLPRPECADEPESLRCQLNLEEWNPQALFRGLNMSTPCPAMPKAIIGTTCMNPMIPLSAITGDMGTLRTVSGVNPFRLWSILFLVLTSLQGLSIVIHDLALLNETKRPEILSIPNLKYAMPQIWEWLSCFQCRRRMQRLRKRKKWLWAIIVPFWTFIQVIAFMAVLYPLAFLVYVVAPIRMSRIMVFLSAILCMLWSVIFIVETAVDTQPYAVLWGAKEPEFGFSCICHCQFFLSKSVILRVIVLGLGVCFNSISLVMRALRGLRRAQWANMFSVLYAVPIEAFPITWERPADAGLIRHRTEGQAIQSEPAFDPFCLMDEQPESAWTSVKIVPVAMTDHQQLIWEQFSGALDSEIGCCGFPRPVQCFDDDTEENMEEPPTKDQVAALEKAAIRRMASPADVAAAARAGIGRPPWLSDAQLQQETDSFAASRFDPNLAIETFTDSQHSSPLSWGAWAGSHPVSLKGKSMNPLDWHDMDLNSHNGNGHVPLPQIDEAPSPAPGVIGRAVSSHASDLESSPMPSIEAPPTPGLAITPPKTATPTFHLRQSGQAEEPSHSPEAGVEFVATFQPMPVDSPGGDTTEADATPDFVARFDEVADD